MQSSLTQTASNAYHQYQTPIVTPPSSPSLVVDIPRPLSLSLPVVIVTTPSLYTCTCLPQTFILHSWWPSPGFLCCKSRTRGPIDCFCFVRGFSRGPFLLVFRLRPRPGRSVRWLTLEVRLVRYRYGKEENAWVLTKDRPFLTAFFLFFGGEDARGG